MAVFPKIEKRISTFETENITVDRKKLLQPLVDYIQEKTKQQKEIRLNFICTHNSRRSHFAQVWAQTMAYYFGMEKVFCYSGGTEATALFPTVAETFQNTGFKIDQLSKGNNPVYSIKYARNKHPVIGFSKKYEDDFNPKSDFAAIMTCSQADENCPFIPGAEQRISIPYEDPKKFDNTMQQVEKYQERSRQMATELFYVYAQLNP